MSSALRVGLLADVHANVPALEAVLDDLARQRPDHLLVLGDSVLKLGDSASAVRLLAGVPHRAVYGNMEWQVLAGGTPAWPDPFGRPFDPRLSAAAAELLHVRATVPRRYLAVQAARLEIDTPAGRLLACHGTPRSCRAELQPPGGSGAVDRRWLQDDAAFARALGDLPGVRVVVCGHVHVPYARRSGQTLVVNPGAVGWGREHVSDPAMARYALLTLERGRPPVVVWRALRYDADRAVRLLREKQSLVEAGLTSDDELARSRAWHDYHARLIAG